MEKKCKNCISFFAINDRGDGMKGICDQTGSLEVRDREECCHCGRFIEMPKVKRIASRIANNLKPWIRERDDMFRRSMELVAHISQLFKQGEFKVFDMVKSCSDMKSLVFMGTDTEIGIETVWTYHCPWNDEIEHFIAITTDGKLVVNTFDSINSPNQFITEYYDIEMEFDRCNEIIDRIKQDCIMKVQVNLLPGEIEVNKCVTDEGSVIKNNTVCW